MSEKSRRKRQSVKGRLHFAAPYIENFKSWLRGSGDKATTIEERVHLLACWTDWVHGAGFTLDTILAGFDASAAVFKGSKTGNAVLNAAASFIRYLRDREIVPPAQTSASAKKGWPILDVFRAWMRSHRGIAEFLARCLSDNPCGPP